MRAESVWLFCAHRHYQLIAIECWIAAGIRAQLDTLTRSEFPRYLPSRFYVDVDFVGADKVLLGRFAGEKFGRFNGRNEAVSAGWPPHSREAKL